MKNKKKVLLFSLLAVFIIASLGVVTYARYQSKGAGTDTVSIAKWAVKVNNTDITPAEETAFTSEISWTNIGNVAEGFIAPGMEGTATIEINPVGSQVAINYWIEVNSELQTSENIKIDGVTVGESALTLISTSAGTCSVGEYTTEDECTTNSGTWSADPHAGMYTGSIALPAEGAMTDAQKVSAVVKLKWDDLNTDLANREDTSTGIEASNNSVTINVIVEQKVD